MDKTFTNYNGQKLSFDVFIDDLFLNLGYSDDLTTNKKSLLSLINGFEDGRWMANKFSSFIWNNIKETALNQEERNALLEEEDTVLERSAKNLRLLNDDEDNDGGEIGEILLYGVMKKYYGALPIVPKIFYKQNTNDYAKGADSVHIVLDGINDYTLWLGESKFYNSLSSSRLDKIVSSVLGLLNSEKLKKELSIVTSLKDLDLCVHDEEVRNKIKSDLKNGISLDEIKKHLHVPILLLHECPITFATKSIDDTYKANLVANHLDLAKKYMQKQDTILKSKIWKYDEISFHLILFPVPLKSDVITPFFSKAKLYKA
jgi:hypothetical protein